MEKYSNRTQSPLKKSSSLRKFNVSNVWKILSTRVADEYRLDFLVDQATFWNSNPDGQCSIKIDETARVTVRVCSRGENAKNFGIIPRKESINWFFLLKSSDRFMKM